MASERIRRRIDSLLDEADQAIANENWATVGSRLRSVLAIDPENTDALAYLAAAERALGSSTAPTAIDPTTPTPTKTPA